MVIGLISSFKGKSVYSKTNSLIIAERLFFFRDELDRL